MTYVIIGIVLAWLSLDAFSETLVNGTPFFRAFRVKWSDRLWNFQFDSTVKNYNDIIEEEGDKYSLRKEVFAYLDHDEYMLLQIFKKDKIVELQYSITNDELQVKTIYLKELKTKDSYYGRWINNYLYRLKASQLFNISNKEIIENLITIATEANKKSNESLEEMIRKYDPTFKKEENPVENTIISERKQEMIDALEKELSLSLS